MNMDSRGQPASLLDPQPNTKPSHPPMSSRLVAVLPRRLLVRPPAPAPAMCPLLQLLTVPQHVFDGPRGSGRDGGHGLVARGSQVLAQHVQSKAADGAARGG